jgi:hypothetical protein
MAQKEGVECHGVLWVLDELEQTGVLGSAELELALSTLAAHKDTRLPVAEVASRIARYRLAR